jgi:hypothetical protein
MESEERPSRPHPSPTRRVEGSVRVCQMTTPPCCPASPSPSWQAETQQLISPRHPFPLRTAPTWVSVASEGNTARTQAAPSSITPANVITLYKHWGNLHTSTAPLPMRYTTMGYTSTRYTSTALYFYKQFTQAPNKFFEKHLKQTRCK